MSRLISKLDLMLLSCSDRSASKTILEIKQLLIKQGFSYYSKSHVGIVPAATVEKIIELSLSEKIIRIYVS